MLKIIIAPSKILSTQSLPVTKFTKDLELLIAQMKETLANTRDPEGVGLAAPQIGKNIQLFIIQQDPNSKPSVFINPKLTLKNEKKVVNKKDKKKVGIKLEGCLSLPNVWGNVSRANRVTIEYQDEKGKLHKKQYSGFVATILQHEYDHLQGILFPKHVLEQKGKLYKSYKNSKNEDIFEEIQLP